jgi:hypothetical protein
MWAQPFMVESLWDHSTGAKAPVEGDGARDSSWDHSTAGAKRQWRVMEPEIVYGTTPLALPLNKQPKHKNFFVVII